MLPYGFYTGKDCIAYGTREDVCSMCKIEYAKEHNCTLVEAEQSLAGQLSLQKVFIVPNHGLRTVICKKHIKQITDDLSSDEQEVDLDIADEEKG